MSRPIARTVPLLALVGLLLVPVPVRAQSAEELRREVRRLRRAVQAVAAAGRLG